MATSKDWSGRNPDHCRRGTAGLCRVVRRPFGAPWAIDVADALWLPAAWAASLDRATILDAIRRRHTYACSHADRPIVRVNANHGSMMGDSVTLAKDEDPAMTLTVQSSAHVTSVSLVRDGATAWQSGPASTTSSAPYIVSIPFTEPLPRSPTSYYWKVTFDNTAVAWTSPIWFERTP